MSESWKRGKYGEGIGVGWGFLKGCYYSRGIDVLETKGGQTMRIAVVVGHSILKNKAITSADGTKLGGGGNVSISQ